MTHRCDLSLLTAADIKRFHRSYERTDECWTWKGSSTGRPQFNVRGKVFKAAAVMWLLTFGDLPDGKQLVCVCDNQRCIRPGIGHRQAMTIPEKLRLVAERKRSIFQLKPQLGEGHPLAQLTEQEVLEIRSRHHSGEPQVSIAADMPVCHEQVGKVARGQYWEHV